MSTTDTLPPETPAEAESGAAVRSSDLFGGFVSLKFNPKDVAMTPPEVAESVVKHFKPSGRILDPCRGDGAFWRHMPGAEWCEIREGRDFLEWNEPVDWIVSNPPFSVLMGFLMHSFKVADNVVYTIPAAKIWHSIPYLELIRDFGGIREILILGRGRAIGLPLGFAIAAIHFKRGYKGETRIVYPPNQALDGRTERQEP
jgi:hypothetical protein